MPSESLMESSSDGSSSRTPRQTDRQMGKTMMRGDRDREKKNQRGRQTDRDNEKERHREKPHERDRERERETETTCERDKERERMRETEKPYDREGRGERRGREGWGERRGGVGERDRDRDIYRDRKSEMKEGGEGGKGLVGRWGGEQCYRRPAAGSADLGCFCPTPPFSKPHSSRPGPNASSGERPTPSPRASAENVPRAQHLGLGREVELATTCRWALAGHPPPELTH